MRTISLIIALGGIFILLLLLRFPAKEVSSLDSIEEHYVASFTGTVVSARPWGSGLLFSTRAGSFVCSCPITLVGRKVSVTGSVESFINETFIRAYLIEFRN